MAKKKTGTKGQVLEELSALGIGYDPLEMTAGSTTSTDNKLSTSSEGFLDKSPYEIHEHIRKMSTKDKDLFLTDLQSRGYPYAYRTEKKGDTTKFGFSRELEGYSKHYVGHMKTPDGGVGGYIYGRRFKDGGYENITEEEFIAGQKPDSPKEFFIPDTAPEYKNRPKLRNGLDTENLEAQKALEAKQATTIGGIGNAAALIGDTATALAPKDETVQGIGKTLATAGKFTAAGAAVGGPWGAAAGAALGIGVGAYQSITANKEAKEADKRAQTEFDIKQSLGNIEPTVNTQAEIHRTGTAGSVESKPVEVEKDELVLRKNSLGKYKLVADFKGGKTHEQGGEDFEITEGDVVIPGKKRSIIMRYLKNGNHEGIESERLKLPKDLPGNDKEYMCGTKHAKLEKGVNLEGNPYNKVMDLLKKSSDSIDDLLDKGKITEEEYKAAQQAIQQTQQEAEKSIMDKVLGDVPGYKNTLIPSREGIDPSKDYKEKADYGNRRDNVQMPGEEEYNPMSFMDLWGDKATPSTDAVVAQEVNNQTPEEEAIVPKTQSEKSSTRVPGDMMDPIQPLGLEAMNDTPVDMSLRGNVEGAVDDKTEVQKAAEAKAMRDSGSTFEDIMDYSPAIGNTLKGLLTPAERVSRRFVTPETIKYKDQSANLRRESDVQERIDRESAVGYSGGSTQVARAGKAAAGAAGQRRKQAINTAETQRADMIEAGNVQTRNQAEMTNIDLANQYDVMDQQNRAAIDAYFDQGLHDFSRIGVQRKIDRSKERMQKTALKMTDTDKFGYRGDQIEFLG